MIKYEYSAIVTNIVDGDTADCVVDMGFHLSQKIRFVTLYDIAINMQALNGVLRKLVRNG